MKALITGGGGFLGSRLASAILERGFLVGLSGASESVDAVALFDARFPAPVATWAEGTTRSGTVDVSLIEGDLAERDAVFAAIDRDDIAVFHLAAMVSGECEQRHDEALATNLDGTRHLLDALRQREGRQRLVFASSVAVFGGEAMPDCVSDVTKQTPRTTYGMTKAIGEMLVNDHTRKGWIDGRSVRLPTVIIRPGAPNAAASGWASGIFREPLRGESCHLPVHRDQLHPVIGYRDVVDSFVALHEAAPERLGDDRAYVLPSHRVSIDEALAVLQRVAAERGIATGLVVDDPDPRVQAIVDTWPTATDGSRALALGLPAPRPLAQIVRDYIDDFPEDCQGRRPASL